MHFMGLPLLVHEKIAPALACVERRLKKDCTKSDERYRARAVGGFRTENSYRGAEVSNHLFGIAIDIDPEPQPVLRLRRALARAQGLSGLGRLGVRAHRATALLDRHLRALRLLLARSRPPAARHHALRVPRQPRPHPAARARVGRSQPNVCRFSLEFLVAT